VIFAVFASVFFALFWHLRRTYLEGHIFCISVLSIAPGGLVFGWNFLFNKKAANPSAFWARPSLKSSTLLCCA
jgi:uncharacterized membrane protein